MAPVIDAGIVGLTVGPMASVVDARWLMAYAAALGETDPRYYDTTAPGGPLAHPLFPVCYEWPANRALRAASGLQALNAQLVHAQHDIVIHRALRAGEAVRTSACLVAALARAPGAFVVFRCETSDVNGAPVATSHYGYLYRGVALEGPDRQVAAIPQPAAASPDLSPLGEIPVAANAAHVYTECARIFNPIHTDLAYAHAAGLPGIILHGTATLALSVSRALRSHDIDWRRVRGLSCRFSGMVLMPSALRVFAGRDARGIAFETASGQGDKVITRGRLLLE